MLSSALITSQGQVFDGIGFEDNTCKKSGTEFSYQNGMIAGALAILASATGRAAYLDTAHTVFARGLQIFVDNGVIFDQCEKQSSCAENAAHPKGTYVRGLGELHEYTNQPQVRSQLKTILQGSMQAMLKTCDDNFNCGSEWISQAPPKLGYNVHYQMNSMELITAYLKTFTAGPIKSNLAAPTQGGSGDAGRPPPFNPNGSAYITSAFAIASQAMLAVVFTLFLV
jgi:Glycosyl hydrolase family 76